MPPVRPRPLVSMLALSLVLAQVPLPWAAWTDAGAAWAQDDDDDDDGGDDDGGDDGGGAGDDDDDGGGGGGAGDDDDDDGDDDDDDGGGTAAGGGAPAKPSHDTTRGTGQRRARAAAPAAVVVAERPAQAPEIVTSGLTEADLATLLAQGFRVTETFALPGVGSVGRRLAPPPGLTLEQARDRVRATPSGYDGDFNHFYRTQEDAAVLPAAAAAPSPAPCGHANCRSHGLVAWPDPAGRALRCPVPLQIGVIDTGVNVDHEFLAGADVEVVRLAAEAGDPSRMVHGTAVVSALAGRPGSRVEGMLPEARYLVADIFAREGGDERADVAALIRGLDLMQERGVRVVNLSLAGPPNSALERMVRELVDERQMVLVAAVGNGGPDLPVAYPAAYDGVIGVTALDVRGRAYRAAQRGPGVDLAAPGVGLLLATSIRGAREQTGTSFATPFVTAAAALVVAQAPGLAPADVAARLYAAATDTGAPGPDEVFGHGVLQAGTLCP